MFGSAADDMLEVSISPANAGTVKTNKVTVTVSTIAGKTLEGVYEIVVQTSSDGTNWKDEKTLVFDTESNTETLQTAGATSSNSGCNSLGGMLLAGTVIMLLKRKR